jgi:hypothetical protein
MVSHELAVEEREITDLQAGNQPGKRHFRCVARPAEHAFAEEGSAKLHPIEATDQSFLAPDLDRVGMAGSVESQHRPLELVVDPRLFAVGTGGDHRSEVCIQSYIELP